MKRNYFTDPLDLITVNRLDVAFRLLYLKYRKLNLSLAKSYYYEILKIQTLNKLIDPDNKDKSNFQDFLNYFESLLDSITKKGFDPSVSTIPLADDGSILNGSHRLAIALFLGGKVCVARKPLEKVDCSSEYLKRFGIQDSLMESAIVNLLGYSSKFRVIVLWPSSDKTISKTSLKIFKNVFYTKEIELTELGKINFLFELYNHMDWIGSPSNNFRGIRQKVGECFPVNNKRKVKLLLVKEKEDGSEDVQLQKEQFRKLAGLGYSSVHSTDNTQESIALTRLSLSEPGLHFINYANLSRFNFRKRARSISDILIHHDIDPEHILFTGSIVLEAYGLRESNDLDYLSLGDLSDYFGPSHDSQLNFYPSNKLDLLFSSDNYFWFEGIKIISLRVLTEMKRKRGEEKDTYDLQLLSSFQETQLKKNYLTGLKTRFYFLKVRVENKIYKLIVSTLNFLRVKKAAKNFFLFLKSKL